MKKIPLWVIHGFLGSGKSRLLESLLNLYPGTNSQEAKEKLPIYYIQCERSRPCQLESKAWKYFSLVDKTEDDASMLVELSSKDKLHATFFEIEKTYAEDRSKGQVEACFLEYNGTWSLNELWEVLSEHPDFYVVQSINVVDSRNFLDYVNELGGYLLEPLSEADYVCYWKEASSTYAGCQNAGTFSNYGEGIFVKKDSANFKGLFSEVKSEAEINLEKYLTSLNLSFQICPLANDYSADRWEKIWSFWWGKQKLSKWLYLGFSIAGLWGLFLLQQWLHLPTQSFLLSKIKEWFVSSSSLLLQIFPFLLISSSISSFIQLFVKEKYLQKIGNAKWYYALPLLLASGFFLPICDCGLLPITTRLTKKGVSLARSVLFFSLATVTNPLVLASTFYAFLGQEQMVWYRLAVGFLVSMLLFALNSLYWWMADSRQNELLQKEVQQLYCQAGQFYQLNGEKTGLGTKSTFSAFLGKFTGRISLFLGHLSQEFFLLCKGIWLGVLFSQAVYVFVPFEFWYKAKDQAVLQLLFLLFAVIFLSVCANANAFMAKSFAVFLPPALLIIYMVFAPLLDLKNMLIFYQGYGKSIFKRYFLLVVALLIFFFLLAQVVSVPGLEKSAMPFSLGIMN